MILTRLCSIIWDAMFSRISLRAAGPLYHGASDLCRRRRAAFFALRQAREIGQKNEG
jgi:hypothetical protein